MKPTKSTKCLAAPMCRCEISLTISMGFYINHYCEMTSGQWSVWCKNLKNTSSGTGPRPEEGDPVLYRNADANAQLRKILKCILPRYKYCTIGTVGKSYAVKNNTEPRFTQLSLLLQAFSTMYFTDQAYLLPETLLLCPNNLH
jgi:hypothetical protein